MKGALNTSAFFSRAFRKAAMDENTSSGRAPNAYQSKCKTLVFLACNSSSQPTPDNIRATYPHTASNCLKRAWERPGPNPQRAEEAPI
eukprot:3374183-Alexandrium_andersonii.AAC.1